MQPDASPVPGFEGASACKPPAEASPSREAYFDNARVVMLALVVVGHAVEPWLGHDRTLRAVYLALYSFHMPVFVWLAGRFASAELTRTRAIRLVERVVVPFVVFQVLYSVFHHLAFHTAGVELGFVRPYWILWFLMSLLWWRLLLPVAAVAPGSLLLALGLSVAVGTSKSIGYDLSLSRTLVFLPCFLLGFRMRRTEMAWLSNRAVRLASVAVLVGLALAAWWLAPRLDERWLYGSVGFAALGVPTWPGALARLGTLAVAGLAGAAALSLVPRRRLSWTGLGSRTLQGYLLHGFLVRGAIAVGWLSPAAIGSRWAQALLVIGAVALTAALCSAPVERALKWLVAPPVGRWLASRPDQA